MMSSWAFGRGQGELDERLAELPEARRRFTREAKAAARLSGHPHIATIYDVGEVGGRPFMVMEFLPGGALSERVRAGPVDRLTALRWLRQAASALDAAHAEGVVHRDIKPANLLLDGEGEVRVADFGIAPRGRGDRRGVDGERRQSSAQPATSPPSRLPVRGRPEPATPYALAVVAYELLTGRRPFAGRSGTAEATAHLHEPVPAGISAATRAADCRGRGTLSAGWAKRPDERFPSAGEFVDALQAALTVPSPAGTSGSACWGRRRPRRLVAMLAAGLLLAGLGGGVLAAVLGASDSDPTSTNVLTAESLEPGESNRHYGRRDGCWRR